MSPTTHIPAPERPGVDGAQGASATASSRPGLTGSAAPGAAGLGAAGSGAAEQPIPFQRLLAVEWRKMLDTATSRWLLICTGILSVLVLGIQLAVAAGNDLHPTFNDFLTAMSIPLNLLLPAFAVLTATSEWSQRTGLVTFVLEPRRMRVVLAKLVDVLALGVAIWLLNLALAALGTMLWGVVSGPVRWETSAGVIAGTLVTSLFYLLLAFAAGALLLSSAAAMVAFFFVYLMVPMITGMIGGFFESARRWLPYLDPAMALSALTDTTEKFSVDDVWPLLSVTMLWLVIPLWLGIRRTLRAEIK